MKSAELNEESDNKMVSHCKQLEALTPGGISLVLYSLTMVSLAKDKSMSFKELSQDSKT
jgi:hypothetical protein